MKITLRKPRCFLIAVLIGTAALVDAAAITYVMAKQRYPWNGEVDVSCTLPGDERAGGPACEHHASLCDSI